jgi:hypothetical protein
MIKTFEQFINESYKYIWVTLSEREVDCSKLTEQEFADFILNDMNEAVLKYRSLTKGQYSDISFFDFDVDPSPMSDKGCVVHTDDDEERIKKVFRDIHNSKYFKLAKGWKFTYETRDDNKYRDSFRPKIKLIFDDVTQKEYNDEEKRVIDDIHRFYKDSKYNKYD